MHLHLLTKLARAAAIALLALLATQARAGEAAGAAGAPAIWTINKAQGTIWLFGSVHILTADKSWRMGEISEAFLAADVVVFETPVDMDQMPDVVAFIAQHGINPPGTTLRSMLDGRQKTRIEQAAQKVGAMTLVLDTMRPWLAALTLTVLEAQRQGFDPEHGVDVTLEAEAHNSPDKEIVYLETPIEQLSFFTTLNRESEVAFLTASVDEILDQPQVLKDLVEAWQRGDTQAIDTLMNESTRDMPGLRKLLLTDRNARWVKRIEAWLNDGKNYLIVVGAGHLVGQEGVVGMLRAKGVSVEGP